MAYTNQTTHYGLPQYVGTDIPSILTDTNDAYDKIDTAIYNVASAQAGVDTTVNALTARVVSAESAVAGLDSDVTAMETTVAGNTQNINNLTTRMTAVEGTVSSHTTSINTLNSTVATVEGSVSTVEGRVGDLEDVVGDEVLQTTAQTLTGAVNELLDGGVKSWTVIDHLSVTGTTGTTDSKTLTADLSGYKEVLLIAGSDYVSDTDFMVHDSTVLPLNINGRCSRIYCNSSGALTRYARATLDYSNGTVTLGEEIVFASASDTETAIICAR